MNNNAETSLKPVASNQPSYLGSLRMVLRILLSASRDSGATTIRIRYMLPQNIMVWHHDGDMSSDICQMSMLDAKKTNLRANRNEVDDWPRAKVLLGSLIGASRSFKLSSGSRVIGTNCRHQDEGLIRTYEIAENPKRGTTLAIKPLINIGMAKEEICEELSLLVEGFDIKILVMDEVIESPKSPDSGNLRFQPFLHGRYAEYCDDIRDRCATSQLFLNGLPIQKQAVKDNTLPPGFIIHLDGGCFNASHLGSEYLEDAETALAFIEHDLRGIVRDRLQRFRKNMNPRDFAQHYSLPCVREEATVLLKDCPLHPSLWGYYPQLPHPYLPVVSRSSTDRDDYLEKTDFIISQFDWIEGGVLSLGSTYAYAVNWPVLKAPLDDQHWASQSAIDIALLTIKMFPNSVFGSEVIRRGRLQGIKVMICDYYCLAPTDERFPSVKVETSPTFCADTNTIALTPESLDQVAALLLQVHSYEQKHDGQIDLKSLQQDTLLVLKLAKKILDARETQNQKAYFAKAFQQIGQSLHVIKEAER